MQEPQITYRGMKHSPAMDARIRELTSKLEEFHPRITTCHVVVDETDRHKHKGNQIKVSVDVHVPGCEIVATHQHSEDAYVAISNAFEVVTRQLDDEARKRRGEARGHPHHNQRADPGEGTS